MRQLSFQLRSVEFKSQSLLLALQIFVVIVHAVLAAQKQEIRHDSLMKGKGAQENECGNHSRHELREDMQVIQNDAFRKQLNKGDYDADWQVKQKTSHPVPAFNRKAMTQPKDKRR